MAGVLCPPPLETHIQGHFSHCLKLNQVLTPDVLFSKPSVLSSICTLMILHKDSNGVWHLVFFKTTSEWHTSHA